jgi:hypothetical protein
MQSPRCGYSRVWLVLILIAFVLLGLIYSATVPLFEAPDEIWHFAFADHLAHGSGLPVLSANKSAFLREAGQPPLYYATVALVILPFDRSDFPTWVRFNASHPAITRGATSDTPNVFIHTAREDWPWTGSVLAVHVGRLVSIALSVLTIVGVYQIARSVTGRDDWALLSAAMIAFTPQFVYISSSVNNDSLAAATSVWVGVAALHMSNLESPISTRCAIGTGSLLGFGLLSKLGGLVLGPLVGLGFLVHLVRRRSALKSEIGPAVLSGLTILIAALAVSGWWFVRNVMLYGDPLGWSVWLSDIGVRTPTPTVWQLAPELPALFRTYWADLPGLPVSMEIYSLLFVFTLVACAGIVGAQVAGRKAHIENFKFEIRHFLFILLWFGGVFVGVLRYMQTTPAAQGRLLFPALAPIAVLMVMGLGTWSKRPWLPGVLVTGLLVLTLVAPFVLIRPAFAKPIVTQLPAVARAAHATFGDRVELLGVHVAPEVVPGGALRVTSYWRALRPMSSDQRLLLRLMRPDGTSAGQLDARLGTNLYPTTLWPAGQIVLDTHQVRADADLHPPLVLHLQLGVGDETTPLLPVTGPLAWTTGDVADVGQVQVH